MFETKYLFLILKHPSERKYLFVYMYLLDFLLYVYEKWNVCAQRL